MYACGPLSVASFVGTFNLSPLNTRCTFVKQLNVFDMCGSFCEISILSEILSIPIIHISLKSVDVSPL